MIISIRGTSGSGKSTLVRKLMSLYSFSVPRYIEGRKQPISYHLYDPENGLPPLAVLGHYESPCGGCDTIHEFDDVFRLAYEAHALGLHVVFEGVLLYCEVPRTLEMASRTPFVVIALNTPIELCVESINLRRSTKSVLAEPVDPKNTITKFNGTITTMKRLQDNLVNVSWCSREEAFRLILDKLNIDPAFNLLT